MWSTHFVAKDGDFVEFWRDFNERASRRILLVAGLGFDPRTVAIAEALVSAGVEIEECWLLQPQPGPHDDPRLPQMAAQNEAAFRTLLPAARMRIETIEAWAASRWVGGVHASELVRDFNSYLPFTDVVVDVTALPRGMYFPLAGTLLELWENAARSELVGVNLHLTVCDDPAFDVSISSEGGDIPDFIHGFRHGFESTAGPEPITIWIPILGEDRRAALDAIRQSVRPKEIVPLLPFPSRDPRRGDQLMLNYRDLLIDSWEIDPRDIVYGAEDNPFDVYLQIAGVVTRYRNSLKGLGPTRIALSVHSSKLMSLGALLAAWELRLAVSHVQPTSYSLGEVTKHAGSLHELFLMGEAYA